MTGPALPADGRGLSRDRRRRRRRLGDDVSLPVVRRHEHAARVGHGEHRPRPPPHQGGRRGAALPVGRLQPRVRRAVSSTSAARTRAIGIADLLLGLPTVTLLATNDNPQALRTTAVNVFVQDDWRVTTRLTVNAGLRYELNRPPVDADDRMVIFDPTTATLLPVGRTACRAPASATDCEQPRAAGRRALGARLRAPRGCCAAATASTTTAAR